MSEPKFYFVYGLGKEKPSVAHEEQEDAETEAKRLACKEMGTIFVVLETTVMKGFVVREPETVHKYDLRVEYAKVFTEKAEIEQADDEAVL